MNVKFFIYSMMALLLTACGNGDGNQASTPAVPVRVAQAEIEDIARNLRAVGNVAPSASVSIVPRVTGEITEVKFKEGQEVAEGQPLIIIDPRPYEATLREKKGILAKSEAQLRKAMDDRARYSKLVDQGYVSREAFEKTQTDAAALKATVHADRAAVEQAALDLAYCTISAPISGRVGPLGLDKGSMVKSTDSASIVNISAISPCYVYFSVPEVNLPVILDHMRRDAIKITATPIGGKPEQGILTLVDNNVDTRTGTIKLRGVFQNNERRLWPGQFVEVELPLGEKLEALLVPASAVQPGRDESYVYSIDEDGKAKYNKVRVLFESNGKSALQSDLKPGDKVVVEGQIRLVPGSRVQIIE